MTQAIMACHSIMKSPIQVRAGSLQTLFFPLLALFLSQCRGLLLQFVTKKVSLFYEGLLLRPEADCVI